MDNKNLRYVGILLGLLVFLLPLAGQDEDLITGGTYDRSIPTPDIITGHRFGELHTFYWEMEAFLRAVEQASDRVLVQPYGRTYQGRTLYTVVISSPQNLAQLDRIKAANLKLTDPRSLSPGEVEEIVTWMPSVVWLGYNIHGNEASAMEAAIRTIYQLAAGTDPVTQGILENVVCIVDPCQNPDGHERFVHGVRSVVTLKSHPQPQDVEHASAWPGGRTNHYLFDLNRDFFLKTQVESQHKAAVYHEWMPHVFADLHEMGSNSTYFFSPPMTPYNEFVKPVLMKWWNIIAKANAFGFDLHGWGYYTRESFDAFYPGYGTSYPSINGAVGMTYEQASARGVSITRDDGTVLTLREAAWHHFVTSWATLSVVAVRKEEKIRDFHEFFRIGLEEARTDPMKEILLTPTNDPHITAKLVTNMLQEGVEIRQATQEFSNARSTSYLTKETASHKFPAGTYIIPLNQPQKTLIKALLAPESPLSEEFIAEERRRQEEGERSHFYDVTAWSLPLTYGIDAYWTGVPSRAESKPVTEVPAFSGEVHNGPASQVYLIPFNTLAASKLLIRLLDEGFRVRMARQEFKVKGRTWPRGTLVLRVNRNPERLHERLGRLAAESGVDAYALNHGLVEEGVDLGSNNIVSLEKPRIALLTESPVSSSSYGAIHYLFEREFGLSFTRVSAQNLGNLHEYNVIVMPSGSYGSVLTTNRLDAFKDWIRSGGTVVAVSGASAWLRGAKISQTKLLNGQPDPQDKSKRIQPRRTPGAIVRVDLNPLSFLSYGVPDSVAVQVRSSTICQVFEGNPARNVGVYAPSESLRLSGFIWPDTERHLAGGGWLFLEAFGRGRVISFVENPNFRASYEGLNKLFLNAILLSPAMMDFRLYD
jgi:hypothetical protein